MAMDLRFVVFTLMSVNNAARNHTEQLYTEEITKNPILIMQRLMDIIGKDEDLSVRSLACILLRRACDKFSESIDGATKFGMRNAMLQLWLQEQQSIIVRRLNHVIAQMASDGDWKDLLKSITSQINMQDANKVVALLNLIEVVAEYSPDDIQENLGTVGPFLGSFFGATDGSVQVACARATGACIVVLEDDAARASFKPALNPMLTVLGNVLNRGDETDATSIMEYLVEVAQSHPMFFKGTLDTLVGAMMNVAGSTQLEFPTRAIALELMVTISETAPALARRCAGLVEGIVPLAFALMFENDEDEKDWAAGQYSGDAYAKSY